MMFFFFQSLTVPVRESGLENINAHNPTCHSPGFCISIKRKVRFNLIRETHFVDDRLQVLSHMVETVPHLFLYQPDQAEIDEYKQFLPKVTSVESWEDILNIIK